MKLFIAILATVALLVSSYALYKTTQIESAAKPQMRLLAAR
jgi:hypothetical protein